jgi:hypothetical protein
MADWFEQNAPTQSTAKNPSGDWFADNAPKESVDVKTSFNGESQDKTISGFGANVLKSTGKLIGDVGTALIHPIDTVTGLGKLAAGTIEEMTSKIFPDVPDHYRGNFNAFVKSYADRYGGWDKLRNELYQNPAGVAADIATAASGAGLAFKGISAGGKMAGLTKIADIAGDIAGGARSLSVMSDPILATSKGIGKISEVAGITDKFRGALSRMPGSLYQSALKVPLSDKPGVIAKGQRAVEVGIEDNLPISKSGSANLASLLEDLNQKRNALIENAPRPSIELTLKNQKRLTEGARQMPPSSPIPGSRQTVLSDAQKVNSIEPLELMRRPIATGESARPNMIEPKLGNAVNQQLIGVINQRAEKTGLLKAAQDAAESAGQPIPASITDIYDVKMKNVIFPKDVANRIDAMKARYRSVNPEADMSALDHAKEEFLRQYPRPLSYKEAQAIKSNTYAKLGDKSFLERKTAATMAERKLAQGIKEELANAIPELKALNEKEWKLLGLQPMLNRAVQRSRNWEVFGIGGPLVGSAAGALTGGLAGAGIGSAVGSGAAIMTMLLRDPGIKSRLAFAINKASKLHPHLPQVPYSSALSRVQQYVDSLDEMKTQPAQATQ